MSEFDKLFPKLPIPRHDINAPVNSVQQQVEYAQRKWKREGWLAALKWVCTILEENNVKYGRIDDEIKELETEK